MIIIFQPLMVKSFLFVMTGKFVLRSIIYI